MACGTDYDSHAWAWREHRHVCAECGVEDLRPARVWSRLLVEMRRRGVAIRR
ncbi:MAG TPA: hypothetical protein VGL39_27975 [Jatrophihabitantaceae bacterium]|jgi:hypothetical protein